MEEDGQRGRENVFFFFSWGEKNTTRERSKETVDRNQKINSRESEEREKNPHPGLMFLASSSSRPTHDSRRTLS